MMNTHNRKVNSRRTDSGDICTICMGTFNKKQIGIPNCCTHKFCRKCLIKWSKTNNTCPVDRKKFDNIIITQREGIFLRTSKVRKPRPTFFDLHLDTFCQICRSQNSEETMLLCDNCNLGFHMHCLSPPMTEIPLGPWHCTTCT